MNVPIFITGYERSGTTLLRRLVSMHPALKYDIVHEKPHLLMESQDVEDALKKMTYGASSVVSGQKIPYVGFSRVKTYIDKFYHLFPNAFLMHIIRNPLEAINSQVKTFNRDANRCIKHYFVAVPAAYEYTRQLPNSCQVSYENLVTNPKEVLGDIYRWMGQEVDNEYIERVITTQGSWEYNGRVMPGLRYFDKIVPKERTIILKTTHASKIKRHPKLHCKTDF